MGMFDYIVLEKGTALPDGDLNEDRRFQTKDLKPLPVLETYVVSNNSLFKKDNGDLVNQNFTGEIRILDENDQYYAKFVDGELINISNKQGGG